MHACAIGNNFILMQDNARPHTARVTMDYLSLEGIDVMEWPARSPDLNPIEHTWDYLYRRISQREQRPQTLQDLIQAIVLEWETLPQRLISSTIASMRRTGKQSWWTYTLLIRNWIEFH